jgi:hypothetical protein
MAHACTGYRAAQVLGRTHGVLPADEARHEGDGCDERPAVGQQRQPLVRGIALNFIQQAVMIAPAPKKRALGGSMR